MRTAILVLGLSIVAVPVSAKNSYNIGGMSCSQVQAALKKDGIAQLRYTGRNGNPLYSNYVSGRQFCRGSAIAKYTTVPTRDNKKCKVRHCVQRTSR